jgi:hypothetical protein
MMGRGRGFDGTRLLMAEAGVGFSRWWFVGRWGRAESKMPSWSSAVPEGGRLRLSFLTKTENSPVCRSTAVSTVQPL